MLEALIRTPRPGMAVAYNSRLADGPPLADNYWDFVAAHASGATVVAVWNGNQHHAQFLVEPDPPVTVWSERLGRIAGEGMAVPKSRFRQLWEPTMEGLLAALGKLPPSARKVIASTPPPKDDALVRRNLKVERWFEPVALELGIALEDLPVTNEQTRLAFWELVQERLREIASDFDAYFMDVPVEAVGSGGFLRAEFSAPDATHANADYGDLVLDHVLRECAV
jgi:hypothetical protein